LAGAVAVHVVAGGTGASSDGRVVDSIEWTCRTCCILEDELASGAGECTSAVGLHGESGGTSAPTSRDDLIALAVVTISPRVQ
jgi:hypothetical protein